MKCLSVKQPWASLIATGCKTIELRTWPTKYRGSIIICASAKPELGTTNPIGPLGVTLALVELTDVANPVCGDAYRAHHPVEGYLAWHIKLLRQLPTVQVKGKLGLFEPPSGLLSALGI